MSLCRNGLDTMAGRQEESGGTVGPQALFCIETLNLWFYQGETEDDHEKSLRWIPRNTPAIASPSPGHENLLITLVYHTDHDDEPVKKCTDITLNKNIQWNPWPALPSLLLAETTEGLCNPSKTQTSCPSLCSARFRSAVLLMSPIPP